MISKRKATPWWREELGMHTKAEVETHIRGIVAATPLATPLDPDEQAWLTRVLCHHYQYEVKTGCGLRHIEVRMNTSWSGPTRGLWFVRTDGSEIDISWVVALMPGGRPAIKHDVSAAARQEVASQIHAHHREGECGCCPLCGVEMRRGLFVHVDHEVPFTDLLDTFLRDRSLDYGDVEIEDLGLTSRFRNRGLGQTWQDHHAQVARLRLTHAQCNLSRKAA